MSDREIALIGNPNCGKTTLFNALTGSHQRVGNWPGVTVDKKMGYYQWEGQQYEVVDLPGTYGIESLSGDVSQDELIAREFVINTPDCLVINILDATNLQRNLYLTYQLLDLNRPMIVVLNMIDSLKDSGQVIDLALLEKKLGCPVIGVSAAKGKGINELKALVAEKITLKTSPNPQTSTLSQAQQEIMQQGLRDVNQLAAPNQLTRWQILEWLLTNKQPFVFSEAVSQRLQQLKDALSHSFYNEDVDIVLASSRFDALDTLCRELISKPRHANPKLSEKFDKVALGRLTGIPIFLIVMYIMFALAINVGAVFIDFFDILFGTIFVDGFTHLLQMLHSPQWLIVILANGIGSGIKTVSTFIPVIAAMFLCLSFLEDSGYLARAAMVVDRGMRAIGLPGKAFVPMLTGFGCNVPAIMGTRALDNSRDRLMSIMMIPFMSCGARLPVYALFAAIFFSHQAGNIVFSLYFLGIIIAVITGLILKFTLLPGKNTPFVMELPPYRLPTLRGLSLLTWERLKSFIIKAGRAIIFMVAILSILNSAGTDGSFGHQDSEKSVLSAIGRSITPIFAPMGIKEDNWPATVGAFTGIFAKESVIGTLNSLYSQMGAASDDGQQNNAEFDFMKGAHDAVVSIKDNFMDLIQKVVNPLGYMKEQGNLESLQEHNDVNNRTLNQIYTLFGSSQSALAYLIFILLYTPCVAALGAIYREAGRGWTLLVAGWTLMIGWVSATVYYQITQIGVSGSAIGWLIGMACVLVLVIIGLRIMGKYVKFASSDLPSKSASSSKNSSNSCCG